MVTGLVGWEIVQPRLVLLHAMMIHHLKGGKDRRGYPYLSGGSAWCESGTDRFDSCPLYYMIIGIDDYVC